MSATAPVVARVGVAFAFSGVVVATIGVGGAAGFLLGRARAAGTASREHSPESPTHAAAVIAAELAGMSLPRSETASLLGWSGVAAELGKAFSRSGLALDPTHEMAALARLREAGAPAEIAALLDARAAIEHAADRRVERDAWTRLARALDPDPTRDSIRAPLLANDAEAVRVIAADLDATRLPLRTATLLGAALLRGGDVDDALDVWRAASVEQPDDLALHLLLGWRLRALDPPRPIEARRHLEAARALMPGSEVARQRLESVER